MLLALSWSLLQPYKHQLRRLTEFLTLTTENENIIPVLIILFKRREIRVFKVSNVLKMNYSNLVRQLDIFENSNTC